jgi:hypothetical protein
MTALRAFIRDHRQLAAALLVLALCLKAALPAGFMLAPSAATTLTITICADSSGARQAMQVVIPAKHSGQPETAQKHPACAFTSLADSALGGADALLLALAFAFILVLGLAPTRRLPFARVFHLRPPLRGPPAAA